MNFYYTGENKFQPAMRNSLLLQLLKEDLRPITLDFSYLSRVRPLAKKRKLDHDETGITKIKSNNFLAILAWFLFWLKELRKYARLETIPENAGLLTSRACSTITNLSARYSTQESFKPMDGAQPPYDFVECLENCVLEPLPEFDNFSQYPHISDNKLLYE